MAALLDGEGSLNYCNMIDRRGRRRSQGCRLNVSAVSNSNPLIIAKAEAVLKSWGIEFVTRETHSHFWAVDIKGRIDNKRKFLEVIFPYLAGKREQARLLLQFMEQRGNGKRVLLTESDRYLLQQVSALNRVNRLGSVETVPEPRETVKIQSDLGSDVESLAEMSKPALN